VHRRINTAKHEMSKILQISCELISGAYRLHAGVNA